MSKVVFVHDHKFCSDGVSHYSEGKISDDTFARYKSCGEQIDVVSRVIYAPQNCSLLTRISDPDVTFKPVTGIGMGDIFVKKLAGNVKHSLKCVADARLVVLRMPSFIGVLVGFVAMAKGKPYAVEMVGDPLEAIVQSRKGSRFYRYFGFIYSKLVGFLVRRSIGTIYVTRDYLQARYPSGGVSSFASNVEISSLCNESLDVQLAKRLTPEVAVRISMIGSFSNNYKGIDVAIESLSILISRGYKVSLHILGSGDASVYNSLSINYGVADFVFFDGVMKKEEVFKWLDLSDLYIQPSRTEGLPRALIEAMSRGLPCVGSRVGGIPELLDESALFVTEDSRQLSRVLERFISDQDFRNLQSRRNFKEAAAYTAEALNIRRREFWLDVSEAI